jgi:hypothetical protein
LRPVADVEGTIGVLVDADERDESEASRVGVDEILEPLADNLVWDEWDLSEDWRSLRGEPLGAQESSSGDVEAISMTLMGELEAERALVETLAGSGRWCGRGPLVDNEEEELSACAMHSGRVWRIFGILRTKGKQTGDGRLVVKVQGWFSTCLEFAEFRTPSDKVRLLIVGWSVLLFINIIIIFIYGL